MMEDEENKFLTCHDNGSLNPYLWFSLLERDVWQIIGKYCDRLTRRMLDMSA